MTAPPKPLHPNAQLGIQATSSVVTALAGSWIGSHDGNAGTLRGLVIGAASGAVVSGVATRAIEHAVRHVKVPVRMRGRMRRRYVALGVAAFAGAAVVVVGGLSAVEASVFHRSLSAEVTHKAQGGTTLGVVLDNAPRPSPSLLAPSRASFAPSASVAVPSGAVSTSPAPSATAPGLSPSLPVSTQTLPATPAGDPGGGDSATPIPTATTGAP